MSRLWWHTNNVGTSDSVGWFKEWGALALGAAGFALGIFNLYRTSVVSRAEKRTQLVVDASAAARRLALLEDQLRQFETEWSELAKTTVHDWLRQECNDALQKTLHWREHVGELGKRLEAATEEFNILRTEHISHSTLEDVRRRYVQITEQSEGMTESVGMMRQRLDDIRKRA